MSHDVYFKDVLMSSILNSMALLQWNFCDVINFAILNCVCSNWT
jgi:hypothetical protein